MSFADAYRSELRRLHETLEAGVRDLTDEQLQSALARRTRRQPATLHPRVPRGREAKALANRTLH